MLRKRFKAGFESEMEPEFEMVDFIEEDTDFEEII